MNTIAIKSERCLWLRGYYAVPIRVCGTEKYIAAGRQRRERDLAGRIIK